MLFGVRRLLFVMLCDSLCVVRCLFLFFLLVAYCVLFGVVCWLLCVGCCQSLVVVGDVCCCRLLCCFALWYMLSFVVACVICMPVLVVGVAWC